MKSKKAFTLPELLVVIVIIGVIAVIAIPSVILINKNINKRLYNQKVDMIVSAAELYASDNPDIFVGETEVKVYVADLINKNYIKIETADGENCTKIVIKDEKRDEEVVTSGCIVDPVNDKSMNTDYVIIRKEAVGVTATFNGESLDSSNDTLVKAVCDRFGSSTFLGKDANGNNCMCNTELNALVIKNEDGTMGASVDACLITGQEKNNYLLYDNVYWRVMGVYNISDTLTAKMITDDNVDIIN